MLGHGSKWLCFAFAALLVAAHPSAAQSCPGNLLQNSGFEAPVVTSTWTALDASLVPGWQTTATDNRIEIQTFRLFHPGYLDSNQYAELNANQVSTLYQDLTTEVGYTYYVEFAHRGRAGEDSLRFEVVDRTDNAVKVTGTVSTGNTAWVLYEGYSFVATSTQHRFKFVSISAAGGNPSVGNFLDAICVTATPPASPPSPSPPSPPPPSPPPPSPPAYCGTPGSGDSPTHKLWICHCTGAALGRKSGVEGEKCLSLCVDEHAAAQRTADGKAVYGRCEE